MPVGVRPGSRYQRHLDDGPCWSRRARRTGGSGKREDVLNSLNQIGRKFRTAVGQCLTMVKKHWTPLAEATTPRVSRSFESVWPWNEDGLIRRMKRLYFFPAHGRIRSQIRGGVSQIRA